ncbi:SDR family NAD(P)-dependent oxidoreductase [Methylobacterium sp. HMF5984]|uniref:SDR family NAD(P)-dependent oxidoreductase n=1 Tax=Methylobacterium sp. HMF5984 TaxID=3367370 RepID=UPI0038538060
MTQHIGTALVTGASSGIGAAYADQLAARGHDLILVARDKAWLRAAAERLGREAGVTVEVMSADLTQSEDLASVRDRVATDAAVSVLVNCAGLGPLGPALDSPASLYDGLLDLNVRALQTLSLAAAKAFGERGAGSGQSDQCVLRGRHRPRALQRPLCGEQGFRPGTDAGARS